VSVTDAVPNNWKCFWKFREGENARLPYPWLRDLLSILFSVTSKQELQTSGISSNTVNETRLVFANFFTANVFTLSINSDVRTKP